MVLYLIGLGLGSPDYLSLKAIKEIMSCQIAYLDTYTSFISRELTEYLEEKLGERLKLAYRRDLEERLEKIIEEAREMDVAILIPGDPLIATTHMSLLIEASKRNIPYKIVHGISIYSAAVSVTGLQVYKFGKITTLPKNGDPAETYRIIRDNQEKGLHTLVLLDTADGGLTIPDALRRLLETENLRGQGIVREDSLVIGLARIGLRDQLIRVGMVKELISESYSPPPHALIFPGELHFMEIEALIRLHHVSEEIARRHKPARYEMDRIWKYIVKTREVLKNLEVKEPSKNVEEILKIASSYVEDAEKFWSSVELFNALAATAYAEGLLDSLRIMGKIDFEWL